MGWRRTAELHVVSAFLTQARAWLWAALAGLAAALMAAAYAFGRHVLATWEKVC